MQSNKLKVSISQEDNVLVKAYSGVIDLKYATPASGSGADE